MTRQPLFVLDSDVFIAAKNAYYAFDICPGFWAALLRPHEGQQVQSIDRVKTELLRGRPDEDLVRWVKSEVPEGFFHSSQSSDVVKAYADVARWVQSSDQFFEHAKAEFARGADGWLVAYSIAHGTKVVTNEQPSPESRSHVKLPDVCGRFGVATVNTFSLLRDHSVRFDLVGQR